MQPAAGGVMWRRALAAWLLIIVVESLHARLRQLFLAPLATARLGNRLRERKAR